MSEFISSPVFMNLVFSLLIIIVTYLLTFLIIRMINRGVSDLKKRYSARKYTIYIATFLSLVIIVFIWIKRVASITTLIGFMGAGLTLALHQPISSIAGWILILIRRPFEVGDRIEIGNVKGDVIDIRLFYTSILEIGNWVEADQSTGNWVEADQSTGRIIHIPNNKVFTEMIINFTQGFKYIWNEIKITITYESDWRKARDIILDVASEGSVDLGEAVRKEIHRLSKKYMIHYEKLTPFVWTKIADFGVELTLRYLTDARRRRSTQDIISQTVLDRFNQEPDIDFAYPTYRVYKRGEEDESDQTKKK